MRKEPFRKRVPELYQVYSPRRDGFQVRTHRVLPGRGTAKDGRNPEALNRSPKNQQREEQNLMIYRYGNSYYSPGGSLSPQRAKPSVIICKD